MFWVLLLAGIALAGLVVLVCYAVWLAHKAGDLMSEVTVLAQRGGQLAELLGQIAPPERVLLSGGEEGVVTGDVIPDVAPTRRSMTLARRVPASEKRKR